MSKLAFIKNINRNTLLIIIAVVGILVTVGVVYLSDNQQFSLASIGLGMSKEKIAQKVVDYINNNNLAQSPASSTSISMESGLVKIKIKIGSSEFDSYATKDGKFLFPQAFNMDEKSSEAQNSSAPTEEELQKTCDSTTKQDSTMVEAYVVSRCPFGLQMQRAMAEAVAKAPELANSIKVRYIGAVSGNTITSMHGEAEAQENLRQICIREEQAAKYWPYVACQMKATGTEKTCEASTGVNSGTLNACMTDPSRGVAYAKKDFDLATKYSVQGSPTMIMNGAEASERPYGGRSADAIRQMVCCSLKNQPSFCATKLNTAEAATSFSADYAGSGSTGGDASCGQ